MDANKYRADANLSFRAADLRHIITAQADDVTFSGLYLRYDDSEYADDEEGDFPKIAPHVMLKFLETVKEGVDYTSETDERGMTSLNFNNCRVMLIEAESTDLKTGGIFRVLLTEDCVNCQATSLLWAILDLCSTAKLICLHEDCC